MRRQIRLVHHLTANDLRIDLAIEGDPELPLTDPHDAPGNRTDVAQLDLDRRARFDIRFRFGGLGKHPETKANRSEEHTSELQSLMRISYAVFCLKKKNKKNQKKT